jgi:hypothetical protein
MSSNSKEPVAEQLPAVEQWRIVSLDEAVRLSGMSKDGLVRYHKDKFIKLSPRRVGMRLRDALLLHDTGGGK